ncbi:hypothetical protein ACP70R_024339 [Stipagrostis hirtigluma subsp. patula]
MRLSHCESHCAAPFRYIPCLPKSKDAGSDAVAAAPHPAAGVAATTEEEPPLVQKIEVALAGKDDEEEDEKHEDGEKLAPPLPPKSSLKKANCGDSNCAAKGNVKWLDLLGKDLTEVKEFEPSECGDLLDEGDGISACVCIIQ